MKPDGEDQLQNVVAVVPARLASTRLPGKMLLPIAGKPLLIHTLEKAQLASSVSRVIAAVDHPLLEKAVKERGFEAVLTDGGHKSGSDRVAEVAESLPMDSIVVNVQGDEPLIDPDTIDAVARALAEDPDAQMATLYEEVASVENELMNPNVVKLVCDDDGYARYFSRSPIPYPRDRALRHAGDLAAAARSDRNILMLFRKHVGLYAYRRDYLLRLTQLPQSRLELCESLEQLRALDDKALIRAVPAAGKARSIGVDTEADYKRVKNIIESDVVIRPLREGEIEEVAQVHEASWREAHGGLVSSACLDSLSAGHRQGILRRRASLDNYEILVASTYCDGIIGYIDSGPANLLAEHDAEIYSFYLRPDQQRKGVGSKLFEACKQRLAARGVRSLCLEAIEDSPFRGFYDKNSGAVVGRSIFEIEDNALSTVVYSWNDIGET